MAAGRRKLRGLVWAAAAAAAKQTRSPLLGSINRSPSPALARPTFFSSWWGGNPHHHHHPAPSSAFSFNLGAAHLSLVPSPHEPVQSVVPAASSSQHPLLPSPSLPQSAYCPRIDGPSVLCIGNVETDKHNHVTDRSTEGEPCDSTSTRKKDSSHGSTDTQKNDSSPKHQRISLGSQEVVNWPNAISFGRLLSGPLLAWLIMDGLLKPAVVGLFIAGASDWFDGYVARRKGINSVFGTYLDPLADKVLIGCVTISMAQAGYLPWALVGLVIARDAALIAGSCVIRAHSLKWQVTTLQDFFNVAEGSVQKVEPLYISKINTVFQLALIAVALLQPAFGVEDSYLLIPLLSWCVVFTTCTSFMAYGWKLFQQMQ